MNMLKLIAAGLLTALGIFSFGALNAPEFPTYSVAGVIVFIFSALCLIVAAVMAGEALGGDHE